MTLSKPIRKLLKFGVLLSLAMVFAGVIRFRLVAVEIQEAALSSSLDPTIQRIAAAIKEQAKGAPNSQLLKLNLARAAMGSYIQYDRSIYPTKTVAELRTEAMLRGEDMWRGDCKSEAVVLAGILTALDVDYSVQVRSGLSGGHAWIRALGYDLNEIPGEAKHPLPRVYRTGPARPELIVSSLTICNSRTSRSLVAN